MFSYMDRTLLAAAGSGAGDELVGQGCGCARQPAVDQCVSKCTFAHHLQLDQHGGISVEVWDREEPLVVLRQHGFLLAEVFYPHRQDRTVGRPITTEPFDVGLAERSLPCEALAGDRPVALTVPFTLDHFRKFEGDLGNVVERDHGFNVLATTNSRCAGGCVHGVTNSPASCSQKRFSASMASPSDIRV